MISGQKKDHCAGRYVQWSFVIKIAEGFLKFKKVIINIKIMN